MKYSYAFAAFAAVALAAPNPDKTVYQTDEVTITSCGPEVTNCPARSHSATPTPEVSTSVDVPETTTSAVDGGSAPPASSTPVASVDVPSYTPAVSSSASASVDIPSYTPTPKVSVDVPSYTPVPSASVDVPATSPAVGGGSSCVPIYRTSTVYVTPGVPVGTPYVGTPYGTPGVPVGTPTTPGAGTPGVATPTPNYTGAANAVNAAGAVAGMGALAAFFL
ncbi:uncharacterized protein J3D65DRAFT_671408 [Phyllosticta citribraziliensis]|uniref:GPI anchored serine-rich protein n=1 Tax=Phyllosticta citribraziliensis TaxID=989973 RepID=A0ABR1L8T8_9PEZI